VFRRIVAVCLLVSLVAMGTSGILMFIIEAPSFTIQMHPVHKLFGLLLTISACCHLYLNRRALLSHMQHRAGVLTMALFTMALVGLYAIALQMDRHTPIAQQMDALAKTFEASRGK
jgi:hypothetical protein